MRGEQDWGDTTNGHKRVYTFTYVSEYVSLEPTSSMVWIDEDEVSTLIAPGLVPMTRDHFAKLLQQARRNPRITITAKLDHLMCNCPQRVTTCLAPGYLTHLFHKQGITYKEVQEEYQESRARVHAVKM